MPELIDYTPTVDSKGNYLCNYDDYLVAHDGTFVFPDKEDIYDFLVREYWPDELATTEGFKEVFNKEFKYGAVSKFDEANCDWHWNECPLKDIFHDYRLEF